MCKFFLVLGELMGVPPERMPSNEGLVMIANFALAHYGHFTVEEIKTAFMLAAAGELESEGHYQVFSAKYFGSVMNAYKVKGNAVAKELEAKPAELPAPENKEADWSQAWEHIKSQAKAGSKCIIIPSAIYDWMVRKGELNLTVDEKRLLMLDAKSEWIGELSKGAALGHLKPQEFHALAALKEPISRNSVYYPELLNRAKIKALKRLLEAA
jgi:hypothetical protein